jgi:hypothetical protein
VRLKGWRNVGEHWSARGKKMRVHIIECGIQTIWAVVVAVARYNGRGITHISHLSVPICHVLGIVGKWVRLMIWMSVS